MQLVLVVPVLQKFCRQLSSQPSKQSFACTVSLTTHAQILKNIEFKLGAVKWPWLVKWCPLQ